MTLVDTGNNIRASHFLAAVEAADQFAIPIATGHDSANAAHKRVRPVAHLPTRRRDRAGS